jgi:hypothetical protein
MQRSGRVGAGAGFICVILSLLAVAGVSIRFLPDVRAGGLTNPDSYMRLVRLREMLDSGTVLYGVARDGSGHGTVLHWSHLLDGLICALALPFRLFLDTHDALHAAALVFGPLNIAALSFAVVWAAAPFAERKWLWLGAILVPLSPAIASYGVIGVLHHHIAIAVAAVACWGGAARLISGHARPAAGLVLGVWAGLGLWLTPESVPLTMMAFGVLFMAWIMYPSRNDVARSAGLAGLGFALVTLLALLADPPEAGIGALEIDRISVLFGGLALAVAGTGVALWAMHRQFPDRRSRFAAACAAGFTCCVLWTAVFQAAMFHSNMALDDSQWNAFFGHIAEMMPLIGIFHILQYLMTGLLALVIVLALAVRRRSLLLLYASSCLTILLLLGWAHVRFAAYPEAAGAIALPVALTLAGTATMTWHQIGQSFTRLAIILLFIQVPYLGQLPALTGSARAAATIDVPACKVADAIAMLTPHAGEVVLADVNDTPEILYKTELRTVGSLYHRDVEGFLRLRAAWRTAPSESVPPEIDAAGISLVLACKSPMRSPLVEDLQTMTLLDQVRTGHPPSWLRQIGEHPASGHVLYEVVRDSVTRADR